MAIVTVGIDLAKNVFAVHGVDETGKPALVRPEVPRAKLLELIANLAPCLIGMEACSGAHQWARDFARLGHTVRLMAPKFVAPYRMSGKRGKNDAADAAAIAEAVTRPNMRFVPVKSIEQQSRLFVHRARQGYVEQRTAMINRIRGLLSELGIVLPLKAATVRREAHKHLEALPGWCNTVVGDALSELTRLDERISQYDKYIAQAAKEDVQSVQLMRLSGVGATTASAIVATVGKGHDFASGRQFCAWLGLVPGQYSSGGKQRLGHITKAGDSYLVDPGCALSAQRGQEQNRPAEPLGHRGAAASRVLESRCGRCGQERQDVLGHAAVWRGFQAARIVGSALRSVV